jgi:AcrR family transcriptional regulator
MAEREDLIVKGRAVFAAHGYDVSLLKLAALCGLASRNKVRAHFRDKAGFYEAIVACEVEKVLAVVRNAVDGDSPPRETLERVARGLVDYVEENPDGFRILMRDSPRDVPDVMTLMGRVTTQVEHLLADEFRRRGLATTSAPLYAQMLVGMLGQTGLYWLDHRAAGDGPTRRELEEALVNLAWNGLRHLRPVG